MSFKWILLGAVILIAVAWFTTDNDAESPNK
jgi:hypothetical protein